MIISVGVVAYNEQNTLPKLFECIKAQTYSHDKMEIVLVDSMSKDDTKSLMEKFKKENKNYHGDAVVRIDAHAEIPEDFVEKNVKVLESGEYVSGGLRPNIIDESTPWKETLLLAEQSMFGSSIAPYRRSEKKTYVKSVFHGAYKREVFDKVGFFNEQLGRTEDNEINYRIREAGYKICYSPDIVSYQHTRNSLKAMLKQKYGNGYWVALTLKACPKCLSIYHFVPLCFVLGIIGTSILAAFGFPILAYLMWGLYWLVAVGMSFLSVKGEKKTWCQLALPFLFFLLHISYGIGSLVGMIKLPFWKYKR